MKNKSKGGAAGIILCIVAIIILKSLAPVLGKLLSLLLTVAAIGVLVFCAIVVITAIKGSGSEKPSNPGTQLDDADQKMLSEARSGLAKLRMANLKIKNEDIKKKNDNIIALGDKTMAALRRNPDRIPDAVELLNFYVPQLAGIVEKFVQTQDSAGSEKIGEQLSGQLDTISAAMEKQFEAISSDENLNVKAELETMLQSLKIDGFSAPDTDEAEALAKKYSEE